MKSEDAIRLRDVLNDHGVEYMMVGMGAAIIQGFPGTTQDIDIYPSEDEDNRGKLLSALKSLGFDFDIVVDDRLQFPSQDILDGKDFIQLKKGPFILDVIFAPDGFENYDEASKYKKTIDAFPVLGIDGIIKNKKSAGRAKDKEVIPRLTVFSEHLKGR